MRIKGGRAEPRKSLSAFHGVEGFTVPGIEEAEGDGAGIFSSDMQKKMPRRSGRLKQK